MTLSRSGRGRRALRAVTLAVGIYLVLAYLVLPGMWRHYEHRPGLAHAPMVTQTASGIPGDPLNVGLVGTREEILRAFAVAGWQPADAVTLRSSLGIAESVILDRPDPEAPVSSLYLYGRRQDLAFEREVGSSARERHHVRFWHSDEPGNAGRPLWLGSVTFDRSAGLSHLTGQITHHIAPDLDTERDELVSNLEAAGQVSKVYQVTGIGPTLNGRNGGGDWYFTDGELTISVLTVGNAVQAAPVKTLPNPVAVTIKNRVWSWLRALLR
jgi:hypothetical protein